MAMTLWIVHSMMVVFSHGDVVFALGDVPWLVQEEYSALLSCSFIHGEGSMGHPSAVVVRVVIRVRRVR
jgi:hypothetical protein